MRKYILLVILALSISESYPQATSKNNGINDSIDSITTYDICSASLSALIDSFKNQEKDYLYFDDSCSFYLQVGHLNDSCLWLCLSSGFSGYITEKKRLIRQELIDYKEFLIKYFKHYIIVTSPNIDLLDGLVRPSGQKYYVNKNDIKSGTDFYKEGDWFVTNQWIVFFSQGEFTVVEKEYGTMPKLKEFDLDN